MRKWALFFLLTTLTWATSCKVKTIEIGDVRDVRFLGMDNKMIRATMRVPISNPNGFAFRITDINIYVVSGNDSLGVVKQDNDKIRVPGKSEEYHKFDLSLAMPDLMSGGLSLLKLYSTKKIKLKLRGYVDARSFLIRKRVDVKENFTFHLDREAR